MTEWTRAVEPWWERQAAEVCQRQEFSEVHLGQRVGVADSWWKREFAEFA